MSHWIGIVRGDGRQAYVAGSVDIAVSKEDARRFATSWDAREAALKMTMAKTGVDPSHLVRMYPWITEVDAEEVE